MSEEHDYFEDTFDEAGALAEPGYNVIEVNYRAVLNFIKLAISYMRRQGLGGSIVIISSATAYTPEQSLPVYSATKLAVSIPSKILAFYGRHSNARLLTLQIAHRSRSSPSLDVAEGRYLDQFHSTSRDNHETSSSKLSDSIDCSWTASKHGSFRWPGCGIFGGGEAKEAGRGIRKRRTGWSPG